MDTHLHMLYVIFFRFVDTTCGKVLIYFPESIENRQTDQMWLYFKRNNKLSLNRICFFLFNARIVIVLHKLKRTENKSVIS